MPEPSHSAQSSGQVDNLISRRDLNAVPAEPTRREMLVELLIREDLLPSSGWPFTTDALREAYAELQRERESR